MTVFVVCSVCVLFVLSRDSRSSGVPHPCIVARPHALTLRALQTMASPPLSVARLQTVVVDRLRSCRYSSFSSSFLARTTTLRLRSLQILGSVSRLRNSEIQTSRYYTFSVNAVQIASGVLSVAEESVRMCALSIDTDEPSFDINWAERYEA